MEDAAARADKQNNLKTAAESKAKTAPALPSQGRQTKTEKQNGCEDW